jgi:hypothetical protein
MRSHRKSSALLCPRNGPLSIDDFFENVNVREASVAVVAGPRTQGACDEMWENDVRKFKRHSDIAETSTDKQTCVSRLMVTLASQNNPTLRFSDDCDSHVHSWFVTEFKRSYQTARVPGKRPWPEFAASLRSGVGFVDADLAAITIVSNVHVVTIENARLVIAPLLLDKPYDTHVMDGRKLRIVTLGAVCNEALILRDSMAGSIHDIARALALDTTKYSKGVIASKVAARTAALRSFVANDATRDDGDDGLSVLDSICLGD